MSYKFKLLSLILSTFFIFSCQHISDGKLHFFKKNSNMTKSCGKKHAKHRKQSCSKKSKKAKSCCKSKKWKKKGKNCKSRAGKYGSCQKGDSVVGLALVKGFGNKIKGSVSFERIEYGRVQLTTDIEGLKPNQKFGFHVHEFGNCENKGVMAGAHLNPYHKKHGDLKSEEKHLGDLGNLRSDEKGKAQLSAVLNGKLKNFMGRSVIIHESEDDLKSQPTGNAGKRIACGVIGAGLSPVQIEAPVKLETKETDKPAKKEKEAVETKPKNNTKDKEKTAKPENKVETKTKKDRLIL